MVGFLGSGYTRQYQVINVAKGAVHFWIVNRLGGLGVKALV